jgi:hypothetical protein
MNREQFFRVVSELDEDRLRKALWNLYWRGTANVRERIDVELAGDGRGRPPRPVKEPTDPETGGEHWKVHINAESGGVPGVVIESPVEQSAIVPTDLGWGTPVAPEQARQSEGPLEILQRFVDATRPPDSNDPRNSA